MVRAYWILLASVLLFIPCASLADELNLKLEYAPAPVDNPLKGLVPYQGDVRARFPHSLEFNYVPYSDIVKGYDEFNWGPLESMLDDIASRGHQAVIRIFLEYPGRESAIPRFLIADGLKVTKWQLDDGSRNYVETPDYENKNLRSSLTTFIRAFGKKYDGDPRLGFITAGLLGHWGEWHTHPRADLFASKTVQQEVMAAYESSFKATHVLLRYPAGNNDAIARNDDRDFGYHDDSFAWSTLDTGKRADSWFYMTKLRRAGAGAETKWKERVIGGEIRPEAWGSVFDENPRDKRIQNMRLCIEDTHVTWLMDSGMFEKQQSADRIRRAEESVRQMGYELYASAVKVGKVTDQHVSISLNVENRGVAPFYYNWQPEWGLLKDNEPARVFPASGKLTEVLPDTVGVEWSDHLDLRGITSGTYDFAVRVANPLKSGKPVRFANKSQDPVSGWLILGEIDVP